MTHILFVCLGNICRSSAAEEVFRTLVARRGLSAQFAVDSAGLIDYHEGELSDPRMIRPPRLPPDPPLASRHRGRLRPFPLYRRHGRAQYAGPDPPGRPCAARRGTDAPHGRLPHRPHRRPHPRPLLWRRCRLRARPRPPRRRRRGPAGLPNGRGG